MEYNFPNSWFRYAVLKRKPERCKYTHKQKTNKNHTNKPINNNKPDPIKLNFAFVCYIDLKYWLEFCT